MGKIIFLTKEEAKKMIDENPGELIPVTVLKNGDSGCVKKAHKNQCGKFVDQSRSIVCEFGEVFNNLSLYENLQRDIMRLSRGNGVVRTLFLLNNG